MQLVFICFYNIYVVYNDYYANQIQLDLTMNPECDWMIEMIEEPDGWMQLVLVD